MTWAKVDDRTHEDPRTEAAGVEAMGLWALALSYMAGLQTDGRITLARCQRLAGPLQLLAARLVAAGWWIDVSDETFELVGWQRFLPAPPIVGRVYFVRAGDEGGPIKIGWTSGLPRERVATLQTGNPHELVLLASVVGTLDDEAALHERFSEMRMMGEWFASSHDLEAFVASLPPEPS